MQKLTYKLFAIKMFKFYASREQADLDIIKEWTIGLDGGMY